MTTYALPIDGITVLTYDTGDGQLGGEIYSDLHDSDPEVQAALDVVESFILAAACAGIDVGSNAFCEAIETTIDTVYAQFG